MIDKFCTRVIRKQQCLSSVRRFATFMERNREENMKLHTGDIGKFRRVFNRRDMLLYADLIGDTTPLYVNKARVQNEGFQQSQHVSVPPRDHMPDGDLMVNSTFVSTVFASAVGTNLPGAVFVSQHLNWRGPVYDGDEVEAEVVVRQVAGTKVTAELTAWVTHGDQRTVCDGTVTFAITGKTNKVTEGALMQNSW